LSTLFSPFQLGALAVRNRIAIAPMCQYSATDGNASDWHMIHLGSLALSGAGLLCIEATAVEPEGRITYADLGLWSQQNADALAPVLAAIRRHSHMPVLIQLAHAGRKASTDLPWVGGKQIAPESTKGWRTWAPSAQAYTDGEHAPLALDAAGLQRVKDNFVAAAVRAEKLGLDGIELHGAHGYLLHQFMSPLSNLRTDAYGGSLENRLRYPLEIFDAVRAAVRIPVGMRISATDWVEGGWDIEQSVALARELAKRDCAFIHVSSGGLSPQQKIAVGPGYQVGFAARIRAASGLPTIAVGLITDPEQAETILREGQADMVAMARAILYDARWPWHAAAALGGQVDVPEQYWRSQPHGLEQLYSKRRTTV
jgi:2,4-dienoyl-CoA reductase-like NADH-dependent reductase (Old Yellow Enzyme family)